MHPSLAFVDAVPTGSPADRLTVDAHRLGNRLHTLFGSRSLADTLVAATIERIASLRHGNLPEWRAAVTGLPHLTVQDRTLDAPTVRVRTGRPEPGQARRLADSLRALVPWRKGPFRIADVLIDSEWRSDRKWARVAGTLGPLDHRRVLDVGCGNGYYLWRMLGAGADAVLGLDPSPLCLMQQQALARYLGDAAALQLPLADSVLDAVGAVLDTGSGFELVTSMGVLHHHREPERHLERLCGVLAAGGELLLETLVWPGDTARSVAIADRYAGMRNVPALWTVPMLMTRLEALGLHDVRLADLTRTRRGEQRRTAWMPYRSLDAWLTSDGRATVEGLPAPTRAIVVGRRPFDRDRRATDATASDDPTREQMSRNR